MNEYNIEQLIANLRGRRFSSTYYRIAKELLTNAGSEKAVELLSATIVNEDSSVRRNSCVVLKAIGTEKAIELLIDALEDKESEVRYHAVYSLGKLSQG